MAKATDFEYGANKRKTVRDVKEERGIGGPPMLRGQDLPKKVNSVKIKIADIREAPGNFKSPVIIDLANPVYEREAFAVNITNLRALAVLVKMDPDEAELAELFRRVKGKTFTLHVVMVNNPSTKSLARSLFFNAE